MNKNQFLSELTQYLTFLSPTERAEVISGFSTRFDAVGEAGEAALILELGTPMVIAIDLKRQMEAGKKIVEAPAKVPVDEAPPATAELNETEFFDFTEEAAPEKPAEAADAPPDETAAEEISEPAAKSCDTKTEAPKRSVLSIIGRSLLSILVGIFCLAFCVVGIYLVVIMGNLVVTGLQNISQTTNALLLFGGGLIAGAMGLLVIWFALWSAISLIVKLFKDSSKHKECD